MRFFPPDPEIPEPEEPEEAESSQQSWWQAPEDELPVLAAISELVAVTDHVAVALIGIAVHREGIEFMIERRLRRHGLSVKEWIELCNDFMEQMRFGGRADAVGRLRFGVVLSDGTKVVTDDAPWFSSGGDPAAAPEGHTLVRRNQGGGGDGSTYSSADRLWLHPLPPAGPIELVMQWPALGIDETRVIVDGGTLPELAASARPFWPR